MPAPEPSGPLACRADVMLQPGILNFNAGTTSPLTRPVFDAMRQHAEMQARDPVEFIFRHLPTGIETARHALADWLHCEPTNLLLLSNATFAVNTLARGITWQAGDEVLLSDHEYGHFQALWRRIAREHGVKLVKVALPVAPEPLDTQALVARFAAQVSNRTKLLFISHVSYKTGMVLPVAELAALARQHGFWSVVDGAHAPGMTPVDLNQIDADAYVGVLHKWMMAPVGASFAAIKRHRHLELPPLLTTSTAEYTPTNQERAVMVDGPTAWQESHEYQGTRDRSAQLVIPAAIAMRRRVGDAAAHTRMRQLGSSLRPHLEGLGFKCVSQADPAYATGMTTYLPPDAAGTLNPDKLWRGLRQDHGIELLFSGWQSPGGVSMRVSTAWFNTEEELAQLVAKLRQLDWARYR